MSSYCKVCDNAKDEEKLHVLPSSPVEFIVICEGCIGRILSHCQLIYVGTCESPFESIKTCNLPANFIRDCDQQLASYMKDLERM